MLLKDRVALITGSGSGIGRATALRLAQEGARLCIVDINGQSAQETVGLAQAKGVQAIAVATDVSQETRIKEMVDACIRAFGRIDILHNNAGTIGRTLNQPLHEMSLADWQFVMDVNLTSMFLCCKYVLPHMMKQRSGVVVNTASVAGIVGRTHTHAYSVSKHGVVGLTKHIALHYAQYNIRANCVAPGIINTPLHRSAERIAQSRNLGASQTASNVPMGREGAPEEIAEAVLYLASDQSSFVTGACLPIDGGFTTG